MKEAIPYAQRYVHAQVQPDGIHPTFVDFTLDPAVNGVSRVRVLQAHWPIGQEWPLLPSGHRCPLFLYSLSSEAREGSDQGHWFGSARWAEEAVNPWHSQHPLHPSLGQVVQGSVIDRAGLRSAVIRLDGYNGASGLLEAFLSRDEVPGLNGNLTLESLFPSGMRVECELTYVDGLRCKLGLSVKKRVKQMELMAHQRSQVARAVVHHPQTDCLCLYEERAWPQLSVEKESAALAPWKAHRILLVDDDADFLRMLKAWFEKLGATIWVADNFKHMSVLLQGEARACTHILVDYGVGERTSPKEAMGLLRRELAHRQVALMTGATGKDTQRFSTRSELPLLTKPLTIPLVDKWLSHRESPQTTEPEVGAEWAVTGPLIPWTQRAQTWLESLCRSLEAQGAMWVRVRTSAKGVHSYQVILSQAVPNPVRRNDETESIWTALEARLHQSLVNDVLPNGKEMSRNRLDAGPLSAYWPAGALRVHATLLSGAPIDGNAPTEQDMLLWFDTSAETLELRNEWPLLLGWWKDLHSLEQLQLHLQEESAFATQGRVHVATQHELLALMQPFTAGARWTAQEAIDYWPQGVKAVRFVQGGLYQIKPQRESKINLRERLSTLMQDFLWQMMAKRHIRVEVRLPQEYTLVQLPPDVIEQPLINLVDNAIKAMVNAKRVWGAVRVGVDIDPKDERHPLVIWVEDDGMGMTPSEARDCFEPRHSHSGGFGMGLYISRTLARAVGGNVVLARNWRWVGTRFELRLPLRWSSTDAQQYES